MTKVTSLKACWFNHWVTEQSDDTWIACRWFQACSSGYRCVKFTNISQVSRSNKGIWEVFALPFMGKPVFMATSRGDCALRGRPVGACCQDTPCELNNVEGTQKRAPDKAITERVFRNLPWTVMSELVIFRIIIDKMIINCYNVSNIDLFTVRENYTKFTGGKLWKKGLGK